MKNCMMNSLLYCNINRLPAFLTQLLKTPLIFSCLKPKKAFIKICFNCNSVAFVVLNSLYLYFRIHSNPLEYLSPVFRKKASVYVYNFNGS